MFFIIKEAKETTLNFSERTVRIYNTIQYQYKVTLYNTLNVKLSNF